MVRAHSWRTAWTSSAAIPGSWGQSGSRSEGSVATASISRPARLPYTLRRCASAGSPTPSAVLQVPGVVLRRRRVGGISGVVGIGRAHDRRVEPGEHEEEPSVTLREQDVRLPRGAPSHEVDPFRKPQERRRLPSQRGDRPVEPRAGRVHREVRAHFEITSGDLVADGDAGDARALADVADRPRVVEDDRAVPRGVDEVLDDETLDERDLRVEEAPRPGEPVGLQPRLRGERRRAVKVLPLREALVQRERVVQLHPDPQLQLVEEARPVEREEEREREHEVRRDAQQDLAFAHVAAHEAEIEELEVAEAAVDEPCGPRGRARGEVRLLDEGDLESAKGGVARDARSDDAAADDQEIDGAVGERPHRLVPCGYLFDLLYFSMAAFMSAAAASSACCVVACPRRTDSIIFCVRWRACGMTPRTAPLVMRFCGESRIWFTAVRNCGYLLAHSLLGPSL